VPSTIPGSGRRVAPGFETTGHAQIVNTFSVPFVLDGLFGEANAEAMDAELDSEPTADSVAAVVADGGVIVNDDNSHGVGPLCVL